MIWRLNRYKLNAKQKAVDMPPLWILMDNSKKQELPTDPTTAWATQKAALSTYPQPRIPIFVLFKRKGQTKIRDTKHYAFTINFKAINIAIYAFWRMAGKDVNNFRKCHLKCT